MRQYDYYINGEKLPFTYEEFCKHYDGVGLREYIKSILVVQKLSVAGQKKFFCSQLPHFKKISSFVRDPFRRTERFGDKIFEYDFSANGADDSWWRRLSPERNSCGILDFLRYLLGENASSLDAFALLDRDLQIVRASLPDIRKRLFPNLSEIKHPFHYVSERTYGIDWFEALLVNKSCIINRPVRGGGDSKNIYVERHSLEFGRDVLIFTKGDEVVSISRSLFYDGDLNQPCMSLFEGSTYFLYNYRVIEEKKDHDIVIAEKYEWIDSACNRLEKDFPHSVFTWLNPAQKISERDWSCLIGRKVIFVFLKDCVESAKQALKFYKLCAERGIQLTLFTYYYEETGDSSQWWKKGDILEIEEIRDFLRANTAECGEDKYKLRNAFDIKSPSSLKSKEKSYLVEKLFRPGEIVLLVAKQKSGKSLFSLDLSMMVACGGVMGDRLKAPKAEQVLYVDAEMPEGEVKKRIDILRINYEQRDLFDENLGFIFPREQGWRLNLLLEKDQIQLEESLKGRKLLVLDNLGKMIPTRGEVNEKQWGAFFSWLERVSRKGITVLLVHHENKVGGHRGTGKITDDVDLVLSLKKVVGKEENSNAIELNIEDSRFLYGNDCDPFVLEYYEDKRLVYSVKAEGTTASRQVGAGTANLSMVKEYLLQNNFGYSELKERHMLILAPLCSGARVYVTRKDFDDQLGVGTRSVQNLLAELCAYGVLVSEGPQKAIKYKLAFPATS